MFNNDLSISNVASVESYNTSQIKVPRVFVELSSSIIKEGTLEPCHLHLRSIVLSTSFFGF